MAYAKCCQTVAVASGKELKNSLTQTQTAINQITASKILCSPRKSTGTHYCLYTRSVTLSTSCMSLIYGIISRPRHHSYVYPLSLFLALSLRLSFLSLSLVPLSYSSFSCTSWWISWFPNGSVPLSPSTHPSVLTYLDWQ